MSLNWDITNVQNKDEVCWIIASEDYPTRGISKGSKVLNPVTESLIFASMATGIGTITEENASEVYARISFIEKVSGALMYRGEGWEGLPNITPEEVQAHIGLSTNASFKDETRAKWLKGFDQDLVAAAYRYKKVTRAAAAA
jgi:hypothetical protein